MNWLKIKDKPCLNELIFVLNIRIVCYICTYIMNYFNFCNSDPFFNPK